MATLSARGLVKRLRDEARTFELRIERFDLAPGDRKAIVGPSGCGKTTALDLLALASRPDTCGAFAIAGGAHAADLARLWQEGREDALAAIRRSAFGYVLQTGLLIPFLTVGENLALPGRLSGRDDRARVGALMEELGVAVPLATRPERLSVGQRQRLAMVRALAHGPAFVLADEPTGALDPASARRTLEICLAAADRHGTAVALVTHDPDLAAALGFELLAVQASATKAGPVSRIGAAA